MNKVIESGYLVVVETWENDGDHYENQSFNYKGSIEDLKRLNTFCKTYLVAGCNDRFEYNGEMHKCYGNGRNHDYELLEKLWGEYDLLCIDENAEYFTDEYIGYTECGGGGLRVFESLTVYEVPERIELKKVVL